MTKIQGKTKSVNQKCWYLFAVCSNNSNSVNLSCHKSRDQTIYGAVYKREFILKQSLSTSHNEASSAQLQSAVCPPIEAIGQKSLRQGLTLDDTSNEVHLFLLFQLYIYFNQNHGPCHMARIVDPLFELTLQI